MSKTNTEKKAQESTEEPNEIDELKKMVSSLAGSVKELKGDAKLKDDIIKGQQDELEKLTSDAKDTPVILRKTTESQDTETTEEASRTMKSVGDALEALDKRDLPIIDKPPSRGKLEELAFMEEMMTVRVHDSTDPNSNPLPTVWNDGKKMVFPPGVQVTCARKFVERLARSKITKFTQHVERDNFGVEEYVHVPHSAPIYPFEVLEDANKRGREWLQGILREAH